MRVAIETKVGEPMTPECWQLIGRGIDEETGLPMVFVGRETYDVTIRQTIWKLVKHSKGWSSVGQWISKGTYRKFPETNGVKLSDSITDQTLLRFAES